MFHSQNLNLILETTALIGQLSKFFYLHFSFFLSRSLNENVDVNGNHAGRLLLLKIVIISGIYFFLHSFSLLFNAHNEINYMFWLRNFSVRARGQN